jgi:hypothetical protein
MVDFATTRAQAEGTTPIINCEEGQQPTFARASRTVAVAATSLNPSPPLSVDWVNRLYHQLAKIHTIITAQLAKCAHQR